MTPSIRVRFAPSPTGLLHVGGLRTALYNYLFARRHGGAFVLRIEDTDQSRKVEGAVENLLRTLEWTGISFDEGPGTSGKAGPYVQSERLHIYREHSDRLIAGGHAYYCFCTPERLKELRESRSAQKLSTSYDGHCRELPLDESRKRAQAGESCVVRLKVPEGGELSFDDVVRGNVTISHETIDDQVILKSDGFPTYHLAVVVDDHLMGISHVIRGEEWLPSTPKHVLLYGAFGWNLPVYAHLPLLLNPDRSKLSKRQGDVAVEAYRDQGYLPEAIVNFVALLGWNPGDDREIFTLDELAKEFSLERVGKSGAIFNVDKLNWLNFQHLQKKPEAELLRALHELLEAEGIASKSYSDDYLRLVIGAMRERMTFLKDIVVNAAYFFRPPSEYDAAVKAKRWKPDSAGHLKMLGEAFGAMKSASKEEFEKTLDATAEQLGVGRGELIHPLRLAVSGVGAGPGLYDILAAIGRDETVRRMHTAIERLQ